MKLNRALPWCLSLVLAVPLVALAGTAAEAATDYQAEDATISQGAVATNHTGYTGTASSTTPTSPARTWSSR